MRRKFRISAIHKEDAYYPYRKQLIGQTVLISKCKLSKSPVRNYLGGSLCTKNSVDYMQDGELINEFYFYAVKLEEAEK